MNKIVGVNSITDNVTQIVPLGLTLLLLCCVALLVVERRHTLWPMFIMIFFVSQAQKIVIFSLDFNQMRIMVLVGLLRVIVRGELRNLERHKIDYLVISFALVIMFFHVLRDGSGVIITELGGLVDYIVPYVLFRVLIQTHDDLISAIKKLAILSVAVVGFFLNEHFTGRNVFSIFGGVPEFTVIRDHKLRCQGAFVHPIIAGVYLATIVPLLITLWWHNCKALAVMGTLSAFVIIYTCASSTPVLTLLLELTAALLFFLREYMVMIRWSVYSMIVFLHMAMHGPVWSLIAHVSVNASSTSWYRFMLIDVTIHYFSDWWFIGSSGSSFYDWYHPYGPVDITDQFVKVALNGGLIGLTLFIVIIAFAFGAVGRLWRQAKQDRAQMYLAWALGCSLFGLVLSFVGVSIWGQMVLLWFMVLAMIVSMDNHYKHKSGGKGKSFIVATY